MTMLLLTSDRLGEGDEPLGKKLMKNFLAQVAEQGTPVDRVALLNRAVYLACEGSEVLESLRAIEARGAKVRSCITCLEHYGLDTRLAAGEIGTMAETVQALGEADKVISL